MVTVLIIGAGINGIGVFRDLALQDIDALIVDKGDFCSGTSAASGRMIHGGLRYLENGEFHLVRESIRERNLLLKNAPHYVKPRPVLIPIFKWFSGAFNAPFKFLGLSNQPAERGALITKIGLTLYDVYARKHRSMPEHNFMSHQKALQKFPRLNAGIVSSATFYDAAMLMPERICIELIRDAQAASSQAYAINYTRVDGIEEDAVLLRDEISGETYTVHPQIVVNAAGPWIDFVNRSLGKETAFIGGTKGSHLILDNPELRTAVADHSIFFENSDGRFAIS